MTSQDQEQPSLENKTTLRDYWLEFKGAVLRDLSPEEAEKLAGIFMAGATASLFLVSKGTDAIKQELGEWSLGLYGRLKEKEKES